MSTKKSPNYLQVSGKRKGCSKKCTVYKQEKWTVENKKSYDQ